MGKVGRYRTSRSPYRDPVSGPFQYISERVAPNGECWDWTGPIRGDGYGQATICGKQDLAHRTSYRAHIGEIPEGLELDHLCRNTICVNPWHLDPVTGAENKRRANPPRTECPAGHPYSGDNLYINPSGRRFCRTCHRKRERARKGSVAIMGD